MSDSEPTGLRLRNFAKHTKLLPIILPLALIELFFFVLHFVCGLLLIGFGFLGAMSEILIKFCFPKAFL